MKKWIILLTVIALLISASLFTYAAMIGPMFSPGSVAAMSADALTPPPRQDRDGVWEVEAGVELHYQVQGEGPPVLLVHGGPAIPFMEPLPALRGLAKSHRIYTYHQRGCGRSTRPIRRFEDGSFYANMTRLEAVLGLGAQIADIERIRRILGVEQLSLIGHSFGGLIATLYAAEFPGRIDKLVLVAPAGLLTTPQSGRDLFTQAEARLEGEAQSHFRDLKGRYFDFESHFSRSEAELANLHLEVGGYLLHAMGYPLRTTLPDTVGELPFAGGWAVVAMYFSLGKDWDFGHVLPLVTAQTTVLLGEDDAISRPGAETYARIKDAELLIVRREAKDRPVRHMPFAEAPRHFAKGIQRALKSR